MITIIKGKEKITCSYRTYDEQFRQLGYVPVADEKKPAVKVAETVLTEEAKEPANEEEKIGSKYGVRRRTTSKKED